MGSTGNPREELGAFLRTRRAELRPDDVGLPVGVGRRRVPGLRRDEVAMLASISTDYYTRVEQGRIGASAPLLATLARALRLNEDQAAYMYERAGRNPSRPRARGRQRVRPQMKRLLDLISDAPAMVQRRNFDILLWNPLAAALMIDFSRYPENDRNFVRLLFTEPALRELYPEWDELARMNVAYLRMEAAENPDDPRLAALVGELSVKDSRFREWWAGHYVASIRSGKRRYNHPVVGDLTLEWQTLTSVADPDQQLIVFTAEPGTPSRRALQELTFHISREAKRDTLSEAPVAAQGAVTESEYERD
jgi:transcriptional regulator with XRE-family HTH domain